MGSPKSTITIIDLSTTIPSFPGIRAGCLLRSVFGSVKDEPQEVSGEDDLMEKYTSRGVLNVGDPGEFMSILTYLKKGNKAIIKRIIGDNALYGGARVMSGSSTSVISVSGGDAVLTTTALYSVTDGQPVLYTASATPFTGLTSGTVYYMRRKTSPDTVTLHATQAAAIAGTSPISLTTQSGTHTLQLLNTPFFNTVHSSVFTVSGGNATVTADLYGAVSNARPIVYTVTGGSAPTGIVNGTTYYLRKPSSNTLTLFASEANALANTSPITIGALGAGVHTLTHTLAPGLSDPTAYSFYANECYTLYQENPGVWGTNDIVVMQTDYSNFEEYAFKIEVFRPENLNKPIDGESFICSRKHKTDGYGNQLYIEDVLLKSKYIRALNNSAIADTVMPTFDTAALSFAGGANGDAVTDDEMIAGLDYYTDKDSILLTLFMDGGWATVDYAGAIAQFCATRGDVFGLLSVPYATEAASTFMTGIVAYADSLIAVMPDEIAKYVALYSSHQKIKDKWNNRSVWVAPDGFAAGVITFTAFNLEIWYAPAGWIRGGIQAEEPLRKFSESQRDTLYDKGVNVIRYHRTKGLALWGNRNRQVRPSSLRSINVMLLIVVLTPALREFFDNVTFDFNTPDERRLSIIRVSQYMRGIKSRKGVTEFDMVDKTTQTDEDDYKSKYRLAIKPPKTQEFINLDLVVVKANDNIKFALTAA